MAVVEPSIYGLWAAKQTAKGTPIAGVAATKAFIQVGGDFSVAREDGSEPWSDLSRFGSQTDFVNTIIGEGNPAIEAQPETLAYISWLFFGQESVTGAADPWTHTFEPGSSTGFWSTWWVRVGQSVIRRQKFADCLITSLVLEGSTGAKVVRATPTILSLDPGITYDSPDPSAAIDTNEDAEPFRYTEGVGTFDVSGTVIEGQSQFTVTWDNAISPYYGDDVTPVDLVVGVPSIGLAITILADADGFAEFNKRIYGTAAPAAGTEPLKALESLGSYGFTLTRKNASGNLSPIRDLDLAIPGVRWMPDVAIPANPDGGPVEISLAGAVRKTTGAAHTTLAIRNGDAAYSA